MLYFYLLKGLTIHNINFSSININELYIKIDKKIILKAKNIYIFSNNKQKSSNPTKIDFLDIKQKIIKNIQYLGYFKLVQINNLNINNNKIDFISFKNNSLTVDNKDIFVNAKFNFKQFNININELNIKKYDLIFNDIFIKFDLDKNLNISIFNKYKNSEINANITINNNLNISYIANIYNITKKTLTPFDIAILKKLYIYHLQVAGDLNTLNFIIKKPDILIKKYNIDTKEIVGNYDIKKGLVYINDKKLNIAFDNKKVILKNTDINYNINTKTAVVKNQQTNISTNDIKVILYKTNIVYNKKININSEFITIKHPKINANIKNISILYINNQATISIPYTKVYNKQIVSILNNMKIDYKDKLTTIFIPKITAINTNIKAKIINTKVLYKENLIASNINKIFLTNKDINSAIYNTKIKYSFYTNKLFVANNKVNLKYKDIKDIQLYKIKTYYDINNNSLKTNIPKSYIEKIKLYNMAISFQNSLLKVLFKSNTLLSQKLNKILATFGVNNSIYQANGKNKIDALITYDLKKDKLHTDIKIDVKHSKLMLTKTSFLDVKYSSLRLKDSNIYLNKTDLDYNISIVNINYLLHKGVINLDKLYIKTEGILKDLNVTNVVEIKNRPENLYIDLKGIDIFLEKLDADVLIHDDIIVDINKLHNLVPYNNYLKEYNINDGKVKVIINNGVKIESNITKTKQAILLNKLKPLKNINITTNIKDGNTTIYNPKLKINIFDENNITKITGGYKNLDINITKFVDQNKSEDNTTPKIETHIKAVNSYIVYNNLKLFSKKLSIDYNGTNAKVVSLYRDRNITVLYNDGELKLYGLNIRGKTFKDLTNTNILNQPLLTIFALKNKNSDILQGFIEIKKGYIKELKVFNNVIATINLIPSLITFQPAGFSDKGYKIKHGYIDYFLYNNVLFLKQVNIKGENITFSAKGYIDLAKKTIDLNVNVNLIVKLIKDIPIINYILLGKDNGITIKISITGDLNNPEVHKNAIENIVMSPLGIIKRLFLTPFRPFMKENEQ